MYLMNSDTYICDFCGIELLWDETSDTNGDMWGCEVCGKTFCSKCLKDKIGEVEYLKVMQATSSEYEDDVLRCPDCVRKKNSDEEARL